MRSLQFAPPWGAGAIKIVERPIPTPGPGQVLVRIRAVSLNFRDLLLSEGRYNRRAAQSASFTPFSDGCGNVEAVGPGVSRFKPGDRVVTLFFQGWISGHATAEKLSTALGSPLPGVGSEYQLFDESGLATAPDELSDSEAATLPCAALTAWRALTDGIAVGPADTVVLQGTGGVSLFGLQFAKAMGCRAIITSSSDTKLARARELGADIGINYKSNPDWAATVRAATGGTGADLILEVGGQGTFQQSLRSIRIGGNIAIIGILSEVGTAKSAEPLNLSAIVGNGVNLRGISVGSADMFAAMLRAIAAHRIKPVVDREFHWTEYRAAMDAMACGEHFGKLVLRFDND